MHKIRKIGFMFIMDVSRMVFIWSIIRSLPVPMLVTDAQYLDTMSDYMSYWFSICSYNVFSKLASLCHFWELIACFPYILTGYTLWIHYIAQETYVVTISKFLYKNFFENSFSQSPEMVQFFREHTLQVIAKVFKVLYFRKYHYFREYTLQCFQEHLFDVFAK